MKKRTILVGFLSLVFLSACTSVVVKVPTTRFESPEVAGESFKFSGGIGLGQTKDVILTTDASARPPANINAPTINGGGIEFPGKLNMGISEKFEVGARGGATFSSPWMLSGKFQILGDPRLKATAYNFSLAVTAAIGNEFSNSNGDQNGVLGRGGYRWASSVSATFQDYALIAGYRLSEAVLIYGGGFFTGIKVTGNIHDDRSDDGLSPAADYTMNSTNQNAGANIGFIFYMGKNQKTFFDIEVNWSTLQWSKAETRSDLMAGGLLGVNF